MVGIPPMKVVLKSLIVELLGTCLLVVIGCGCALVLTGPQGTDVTGVALAWGFTVATLGQAFGHIGGCHINPCVTLAMFIIRKQHLVMAGLYIITQCMGAYLGALILKMIIPAHSQGNLGMTTLAAGVTPIQGLLIELIATFLLVSTVLGVTDEEREDFKGSPPLAIGICVTALILFCGPLTNASLNTARSLGPLLIMRKWENQWIYCVGPFAGSVLASVLYQLCFKAQEKSADNCETKQNMTNLSVPAVAYA